MKIIPFSFSWLSMSDFLKPRVFLNKTNVLDKITFFPFI